MELGQWVLGSEWERKRETHRQHRHGMAEMKGKDITQSCHLLILLVRRLKSRMRRACRSGRQWELGLGISLLTLRLQFSPPLILQVSLGSWIP